MSNTAYPKGAEKFLSGSINITGDTIKAALVPSTYTYSAAHEFLSAVGTRVGTDQALTGKSVAGGVFDAAAVEFGVLAPGNDVKAVVLYKDTGNPATSPLLFYMDSVQGLPMSTNGGKPRVAIDLRVGSGIAMCLSSRATSVHSGTVAQVGEGVTALRFGTPGPVGRIAYARQTFALALGRPTADRSHQC